MPVTIQPTYLKYKNSNGQFQNATAIKGDDGVSPTIAIEDITGGHRLTITDVNGAHSFNIMDAVGGGTVTDVQVNGVSVLSQGVADVPLASSNAPGVAKIGTTYGVNITSGGALVVVAATDADVKGETNAYKPIVPARQHQSVFYGLAKAAGDSTQSASANAVGTYTDAAKSAISTMLNGSVAVTGSTPSINALPGIRYICGEVATLDITLPASGIVDVVFESGSTPTVLTATGVTWPAWFDATSLEANTTYEISIADGYGAVMTWA